jgi:hypothetical protein
VHPSNSNGYTPIKSVAMTTLAVVSPALAVDVMLPTYQPNPNWYGTAQAYIDCPSRNIYSQFLNQVELTGKPLGVWDTIYFTLANSWLAGLLQSGYSDLTITVVLNVQVPTPGIYFIDNLRFLPLPFSACGGRPNGTFCTDNNACTTGDACLFGACQPGSAVPCTASDQCHEVGTCNPATGVCSDPVKQGSPPCDDGNACTQTDLCIGGVCTGSNPLPCPAPDQCHVGFCDSGTGACSSAPLSGTACDDGDACTVGDTCQAGVCTSGTLSTGPVVPAALSASSSPGGVALSWTASPGATDYQILRATTSGGPYSPIGNTGTSGYLDTSLANASVLYGQSPIYYYVVAAANGCGVSAASDEVSGNKAVVLPPRALPAPPRTHRRTPPSSHPGT